MKCLLKKNSGWNDENLPRELSVVEQIGKLVVENQQEVGTVVIV